LPIIGGIGHHPQMGQMHGMQRFAAAAAMLVCAALPAAAAEAFSAGIANIVLKDPVEGGRMQGVVVYPTRATGRPIERGPFTIDAVPDAAPVQDRFPLIIFSHGTGGSELGHHDSLTALARAGFVAAAIQHPRDNVRDDSGFGTDLQIIGRAHHIVAFVDGVLADPRFASGIDRTRIGIAGFSAGGYTALLSIGGRPNFALRADYARAVPDDPLTQRARAAEGRYSKPGLAIVAEPRVRSAFVMAPALGHLFDKEGLADVRVPVRLYRAGADEVLRHPWNAERVRLALPTAPEYEVLEGAGHYIFLAPCSPSLRAALPALCTDPPGIDREAIHKKLNADMVAFFRRTLVEP
jgi:predicted dienelactone hydrolase